MIGRYTIGTRHVIAGWLAEQACWAGASDAEIGRVVEAALAGRVLIGHGSAQPGELVAPLLLLNNHGALLLVRDGEANWSGNTGGGGVMFRGGDVVDVALEWAWRGRRLPEGEGRFVLGRGFYFRQAFAWGSYPLNDGRTAVVVSELDDDGTAYASHSFAVLGDSDLRYLEAELARRLELHCAGR